MRVIIEIPETEKKKDAERVLNYFYEKCLYIFALGEIESFDVKVELADGKELKGSRKQMPKEILNEDDKLIGYPLDEEKNEN